MSDQELTFRQWLLRHVGRNSPLGDLARDAQSDSDSAVLKNTKEAWVSHLRSAGACPGAHEALAKAWVTYGRALKRMRGGNHV